jgi:hypothetical protein
MAFHHSGRFDAGSRCIIDGCQCRKSRAADAARPQQSQTVTGDCDNGRLDAGTAGAAVNDERYPAA